MGKFKAKKKGNHLVIYIGLFLLSIAFTIKYLYQENLINNNTIVDILINDTLGTFKNNINDVDFLFKYAFNTELKNNDKVEKDNPVLESPENKEELQIPNNKDDDSSINEEKKEPIVYLYNTHQEEQFKSGSLEAYNIPTTVLIASKILKEYLADLKIEVIVEEQSVTTLLHSLNLKYGSSYKVSRMLMEEAQKENPSLKYFIDLHRDASSYENTTIQIEGISYARLLFVIGLENPNYKENLAYAENLKAKIEAFNPKLFRGIMKKSGSGVNGIYNQDFSNRAILIEVGGQYNNIEEVNNSLRVLANILAEFIKEDINE